ncbi:MAG: FAD binding domain-containing protein [Pirellulales bacterium]
MNSLYDTQTIAADLRNHENEAVAIHDGAREFFKPATVVQAAAHLAARPDCLIVSGGTDLGVQANKGFRTFESVLSTRSLTELRTIERTDQTLSIGALATLTDLEAAVADVLPSYAGMLDRFGSPLIKNAGTLGGNIANGSPIGDTMPGLFVLQAEIELVGPRRRRVDINDYYTGYKRSVKMKDELLARVHIPLPAADEVFRAYKVSKRRDLDISSATAAFWLRLDANRIGDIRIAYGGVGPNIVRLRATEAAPPRQALYRSDDAHGRRDGDR